MASDEVLRWMPTKAEGFMGVEGEKEEEEDEEEEAVRLCWVARA